MVHLATGLVVGYPPCPYIAQFKDFLENHYGMKCVVGTHPIPQKYLNTHAKLGTWEGEEWAAITAPTMTDEATRRAYD